MVSVKAVANYFMSLSEPDLGDAMTHLKLQKLVYYSQGVYIALKDTRLFSEKIYHWKHGPVVKELYDLLKHHAANPVSPIQGDDAKTEVLSSYQKEILNDVYDVYGQFSAWKLRNMTHNESPWLRTQDDEEITFDLLKEYFKTQIVA